MGFKEWVQKVHPKFEWYDHCEKIGTALQRVADGELKRLIVMLPPRHSKSEEVSRLFTAYYLYRHPSHWVGLASYAAALAYKLSRASRDFARLGGVELRDDADAVHEWQTTAGGGLWAAGVGGPATGKGMHVGIIDDPIKNAEEAASDAIGERNDDWYASTWYTRQEPDAALIVVMTRWPGPGDMVGKLFAQESEDDHPERWHVIALESIKTDEPYVVPATCTLEADDRAPGEALCPQRYPVDKLRKIWSKIGNFFFQSLFQQRESHRDGKMFKWDWWVELKAMPMCTKLVRYWDLAGTEPKKKGHDPDFTATTMMGRMPDGRAVILHNTEFRESIGGRDTKIEEIAIGDRATYGTRVTWWFEKETGIDGEKRMNALVRRIQKVGLTVLTEPASGKKILRAEPLASAAEAGNVCLAPEHREPWWDRFRKHMGDFSLTCAHDDTADSASGAYNKIETPMAFFGQSTRPVTK